MGVLKAKHHGAESMTPAGSQNLTLDTALEYKSLQDGDKTAELI